MNHQQTCHVFMVWVVAALIGCGGCVERVGEEHAETPVKLEPRSEALDIPLEPRFLRLDHRLLELAGEVDGENRYPQAVMVTALSRGEGVMACSGTAISRYVVLTAGHCVCSKAQVKIPEGGSRDVIDASACFEAASVTTLIYKPQLEEGATLRASKGTIHEGRVQPHPRLRVVLDEQGRVLVSQADLALITLSRPLGFSGLPLADEEVRVGDLVTIVGYGYDEVVNLFGSERRFSLNTVTRLMTAEDERVLIQQPERHRYRQDSGGPCLRPGAKGPMLVGISSRWLGEGAAFTSIHDYRGWLRDVVQRAETATPSQR